MVEVSLLENIVDDPLKYGTVVSGEDSAEQEKGARVDAIEFDDSVS